MTILQDMLIDNIPKCKTLREAGVKAGYSKISGQIYRKHTKTHIANRLEASTLKADDIVSGFISAIETAIDNKDTTNRLRGLEALAKIKNMMSDKGNTTTINILSVDAQADYNALRSQVDTPSRDA